MFCDFLVVFDVCGFDVDVIEDDLVFCCVDCEFVWVKFWYDDGEKMFRCRRRASSFAS